MPKRIDLLFVERQRVADQLSLTRACLCDLRVELGRCPTQDDRQLIEAALEDCRVLASKLLQLEATVLARQRQTPKKPNRLTVRLAALDGALVP